MVTINPKSLTLGELYGEFDSNTTEWTDGLLSSHVRKFVQENLTDSLEGLNSPSKKKNNYAQEGRIMFYCLDVKFMQELIIVELWLSG